MRALVWLGLLGSACGASTETNCTDGVDDDKDGLIDSFDSDCSSDEPADDTDDPSGPGPFIFDGLVSHTLNASVFIQTRQGGGSIEDDNPFCSLGICDCKLFLRGDGAFLDGFDAEAVFIGDFVLDKSEQYDNEGMRMEGPCVNEMLKTIWYSIPGTSVYHTFRWSADGSKLDEWIAHLDEEENQAVPESESPTEHRQFYTSRMATPYDEATGTASYEEAGSFTDGSGTYYVTTTFSVDFE